MRDSRCALCDVKLSSIFRIYFGEHFVSCCVECYGKVYSESERARVLCIETIFKNANRDSQFQERKY